MAMISDPKVIDVGKDYCSRLQTRELGLEFRAKFLEPNWDIDKKPCIILDFVNVLTIAPSFADAAFSHFCDFIPSYEVLQYIKLVNITDTKRQIIEIEIEIGAASPIGTDKALALAEEALKKSNETSVVLLAAVESLKKRKRKEAQAACPDCGNTDLNHLRDAAAHGILEIHMDGSERFECECGKVIYHTEGIPLGFDFQIDGR